LTSPFRHRGIVEGFYGRPWAHADRLWWIDQLARLGMNTYVVAPKDDPLQRQHWHEPYPPTRRRASPSWPNAGTGRRGGRLRALAWALDPLLGRRRRRATLVAKLRDFVALGSRFLTLCVDDVPSKLVHAEDRAAFPSLAAAHVSLAHHVRAALAKEVVLWLVPTDYAGSDRSAYLEELGATLDPTIEVAWTDRTTVPPSVRADGAQARAACAPEAAALGQRARLGRPDANDAPRAVSRARAAHGQLSGVLLNPMQHAPRTLRSRAPPPSC
jgi:hyaluronoglucosaminidase